MGDLDDAGAGLATRPNRGVCVNASGPSQILCEKLNSAYSLRDLVARCFISLSAREYQVAPRESFFDFWVARDAPRVRAWCARVYMASVNSATCPPLVFEGSLLCTKVRGKWHVTSPAEVPRWCQLKCVNDDTRLPWTANVTLKDLFGHCPCDDCRLEHGTAGRFEALANQFYVDVLGLVETSSDVEQLAKSVFKQAMSKRRHTELVADLTALLCYKNLQVDQFSFKKAFISETQTRFDRALERARQLDDSADVTLAREKLLQVTVFISQAHSRRLIPWKVIRASVDVLIGEVNSNVHPAACEVCMEGAVSLLCGLGPRADLDVWAPWLETLKMKSLPARIAKMITSLGLNADEGSSSACRTESGSIQKF